MIKNNTQVSIEFPILPSGRLELRERADSLVFTCLQEQQAEPYVFKIDVAWLVELHSLFLSSITVNVINNCIKDVVQPVVDLARYIPIC